MTELHPQAQRVVDAAAAQGLELRVIEHQEGTRTAEEAAAAVGCDVGQIVKSLLFALDDGLVLALTSGANRVDTAALAGVAGGTSCGRADADEVRRRTGFAIGGVPPFGHENPVRTFIDPALLHYDVVWAAAGTPRHLFGIDPDDLAAAAAATVADFTAH